MRKLILLAGALTIATATPVMSQGTIDIGGQLEQLQNSITSALQSNQITRSVAENLRSQLREIRRLQRRLSEGGLTQIEIDQLTQRIQQLQQRLQQAINNPTMKPCPPGLAKKTPPCIPPGQAKKMTSTGN